GWWSGRPDSSPMSFNHPAGQRQGKSQTAAFFIERSRRPLVCLLYTLRVCDHDDRVRTAVDVPAATVRDYGRRTRLFAQNCSEDRVEGAAETRCVAVHRGTRSIVAHDETHPSVTCLMHMLGHIGQQRREVERLA